MSIVISYKTPQWETQRGQVELTSNPIYFCRFVQSICRALLRTFFACDFCTVSQLTVPKPMNFLYAFKRKLFFSVINEKIAWFHNESLSMKAKRKLIFLQRFLFFYFISIKSKKKCNLILKRTPCFVYFGNMQKIRNKTKIAETYKVQWKIS